MYDPTIVRCREQLDFSVGQKKQHAPNWRAASLYFNNDILDRRGYDPKYLAYDSLGRQARGRGRWGIDNHIPDNVRARIAYASVAPFNIEMHSLAPSEDPISHEAVNAIYKCVMHELENKEFDRVKRDIITRATLFNMVGVLDWWNNDRYDPGPSYRVISHDDLFFDPTASAPVNEQGGPRWVCIRRMLSEDEKRMRYGNVPLRTGFTGYEKTEMTESEDIGWRDYENQYEIYEWYGINEMETTIPSDEMEVMVIDEVNALFDGTLLELNPDINHRKAVEIGDELMRGYALSMFPDADNKDFVRIEGIMRALSEGGLGSYADMYINWRGAQIDMTAEDEGGTRPKYEGYVYRCEFQVGHDEWLVSPTALDFPHYQIPVSLFWTHKPTQTLWGKGIMSEVIGHQEWIEWWQKCHEDYSNYAARPPFLIDTGSLDPPARTDETKMQVKEALVRGFRILWMKLTSSKVPFEPKFATIGQFSPDVPRLVEYHRFRIKEILGPVPALTGNVSGETSGRAFGMRMQAAGTPVNDMLSINEGPLEAFVKRMSMNVFEYGDLYKVENIAGTAGADAIEILRQQVEEQGYDFRYTVQVDLGSGVPRDFYSLVSFGQAFAANIDMEEFGRVINSPVKLRNIPQQTPGAPGQGGSIDAGLVAGMT
jgi:hypothetical protein